MCTYPNFRGRAHQIARTETLRCDKAVQARICVHWEGVQLSRQPCRSPPPEAWQASEETICLAEAQAGVVPRRDRLGGDAHLAHERPLDAVDSGRLRNAPRKWAEPEVVN